MTRVETKVLLFTTFGAALAVVACTAGTGAPTPLEQAYQNRPGDFSRPTEDNQDLLGRPGGGNAQSGTGDAGNNSQGGQGGSNPGSSGNGGGNAGNCPPCDAVVTCEVTFGGQTSKPTVQLKTKGGVCVFENQGGDIVLACGGNLTQGNNTVGTWKNCTRATTEPAGPAADAGSGGGGG